MPLRNRSDFKQALSTLERLQAQTMAVGTEFISTLAKKPTKMAFTNSTYAVTDGSFAADGGLL